MNKEHQRKQRLYIIVGSSIVGILLLILMIIIVNKLTPEEDEEAKKKICILKENYEAYTGGNISYKDLFENPECLGVDVTISFENDDLLAKNRGLIYIKDNSGKEVINSVGKYTASIKDRTNNKVYVTKVVIKDKTAPILELKDLTIMKDQEINFNDFIVSCTDNSGDECTYKHYDIKKKEVKNIEYDVSNAIYYIEAFDSSGNSTIKEVKLIINK